MSFEYSWTPVLPKPPGGSFSIELADLLMARISGPWTTDRAASLRGQRLDAGFIEWLTGVRDATSDDKVEGEAQELIDAIRKYGVIELSVDR